MRRPFKICEYCGAALDSGEKCDCQKDMGVEQQETNRSIAILCDADKRNKLNHKYGNTIGTWLTMQEACALHKK